MNIPNGYKQTVVGVIPQEWEVKALGYAYKLQGGYAFKSELFADIGIPIVRISNLPMDSNIVDITDCVYYPNTESIKEQFIIKQGMLLIAMSGATTGKTAVYNNQNSSYLNQRVGMFCSKNDDITYNYLLQLVQSPLYSNALKPLLIAGAQPNIAPSDVENMKFPVPPMEEQRKIAEILGIWDEAIEKQSRLIERLEVRKRALMQCLLTGRTRLSGFTTPWQKIKLGEIGKTYNGLTGKSKEDFEDGNAKFIPYINVFSNEKVNIDKLGVVSVDESEKQNKVQYGDIFFTVSSETPDEVGMASVLLEYIDDTYLNSFCFGYRLNDFETLNPIFASYILRGDRFRNYMMVLAQGSTRFNISKNEVMKLRIELPSLPEQKAIAEVLTTADNEIATHRKKLDALRLQKRGLMQQLLTGKTRVKI